MNSTTATSNGQHLPETFDPTDEGLREAWSSLLARYQWDCFATLTFKNERHDPFEIINAFNIWMMKWHMTEAAIHGFITITRTPRHDRYGRRLPDRIRRQGNYWNRWRKGIGRPVTVVGIEPHKSGALHMHAVIKFNTRWEMNRSCGWRHWADPDYVNGMDMGWARLEPPNSQDDVASYCSKYVTKGGELVLSDSFTAGMDPSPFLTDAADAA